MAYEHLQVIPTDFDAGYTRAQQAGYEAFIRDFVDPDALEAHLDPAAEATSLWTDGALEGVPGQASIDPDTTVAYPRMAARFLQASGNEHFRQFRARTVGGMSQPDPNASVRLAYLPEAVFFGLEGLPENVRALGAATTTVAGIVEFPYFQTAAHTDYPPGPLAVLDRPHFGTDELRPGTSLVVRVLFAVHSREGKVVGRTGLCYEAQDVPLALHRQIQAQRGGPAVQALPSVDELAEYLVDHRQPRDQ